MSAMEGNPHYEQSHNEDAPEWAHIEALRALAYEKRTANLIALMTWMGNSGMVSQEIASLIDERLGL